MILRFIRKSLAFSLSLSILMGTLLIVLITMGFLYFRSRQQVRQVSVACSTRWRRRRSIRNGRCSMT